MSKTDNKDILFIHLHNRPSLLSPFYSWVDSYLSSHSLLDDTISYLQNYGIDMSDIYPSDYSFDDFYASHMDELDYGNDDDYDDYELVYPPSSSSSKLCDDDNSSYDEDDVTDYSFDDACYNSSKRIYYYDDYMNKDNVMKFRSLRTFEKFCDERGIYISPCVLSLMKYRTENHCCINKNVLLDENLVVLEAEESYGSMVYSAALPDEIDAMYNVLSL